MSKKKWDGRYENTYEGKQSLEDDIKDYIEKGVMTYPTSSGGTVRQSDTRIDVYGPSDSKYGHSHDWYDLTTNNKPGHHD